MGVSWPTGSITSCSRGRKNIHFIINEITTEQSSLMIQQRLFVKVNNKNLKERNSFHVFRETVERCFYLYIFKKNVLKVKLTNDFFHQHISVSAHESAGWILLASNNSVFKKNKKKASSGSVSFLRCEQSGNQTHLCEMLPATFDLWRKLTAVQILPYYWAAWCREIAGCVMFVRYLQVK